MFLKKNGVQGRYLRHVFIHGQNFHIPRKTGKGRGSHIVAGRLESVGMLADLPPVTLPHGLFDGLHEFLNKPFGLLVHGDGQEK